MKQTELKTVFIRETISDSGVTSIGYKNLTDLLRSVNLKHLYRTVIYHLARGESFQYENIVIRKLESKIETLSFVLYNNQKIAVEHGKQRS